MPKTTYCQNCIEDFDDLVLYKDNWVCESCLEELKKDKQEKREVPEWEHTDESLQVRQLEPGEVLPEARTSFTFSTASRGAETGAFALHVGLRWWRDREE
jgi:hypothetical protein